MDNKMLQYEFTQEEVQYLAAALNRTQIAGVEQARSLLHMTDKLEKPLNVADLEKDQLEALKNKYEKKDKK